MKDVSLLQIFLKVAEDNGVDTEVPSGEDSPLIASSFKNKSLPAMC